METTVHPQMEALKSKYFQSHPDEPLIFHRKELVNARSPFENLKDPAIRAQFDQELLNLMTGWKYTVISVCLDKKNHKENYEVWRYDPYHYCLAVLLERYVFFLERLGCNGDMMAESRGGKEDRRLKDSFARLWQQGTEHFGPERFQDRLTSRQLKVKMKANNIAGLQLSDLLAHTSRNEILKEQGFRDREFPPFVQKVVQILQSKYDQQKGRIFGKKFL